MPLGDADLEYERDFELSDDLNEFDFSDEYEAACVRERVQELRRERQMARARGLAGWEYLTHDEWEACCEEVADALLGRGQVDWQADDWDDDGPRNAFLEVTPDGHGTVRQVFGKWERRHADNRRPAVS
jgi:hypothetical protein